MHATKCYKNRVFLNWFVNNATVYMFSSYKIFTNSSPNAVRNEIQIKTYLFF